ncbi:actin-85C-like isoform X1 [Mastomys coucha]|uniref:actin-85C-like isoform X1 n=1 Tax=Mastomys coucha TaxID=35658 RepID=UPI0012614352|nr:actin-85C-like isoform X1 [Mastomys coucha]XP_031244868.1 actin-85C-like isoform X1 [Mastomys coucha]
MDKTPLICDYGSGFSKVGFAGAQAPRAVFPTILGKMKHTNVLEGLEEKDWFIGAETQSNRTELNMYYPISRGVITNWDNVEKIWHYSFYHSLQIAPEQHPILITEAPLTSKEAKSRMTQILFETFNFPALYTANQAVLSLYASGRISGTTIESGDGMTYFVPIMNGYPLHLSTTKLDIAGQDLTLYLMKLLSDNGNVLETIADFEYIRDLKDKYCYVALDYEREMTKTSAPSFQKKFTLPDGKEINLGQEAFMCSEALFNTSLLERTKPGIHMHTLESIMSCEKSHWRTLFSYIILSGGTGACSGLQFRLKKEMAKLVSPDFCLKVVTSPYAKYGAWIGASILCSLPMFKDMWITNHEYLEIGPSVICRRSF